MLMGGRPAPSVDLALSRVEESLNMKIRQALLNAGQLAIITMLKKGIKLLKD